MIYREQIENWNNMTVKYHDPDYEWAIGKVAEAEVKTNVDPAQGDTYDPYNGAPPVDDAYKQDFSTKYVKSTSVLGKHDGTLDDDLMDCLEQEVFNRFNDRGVMSMVREFAEVMDQKPSALRSLDLVYEEYEEFREAGNPKDDLKELADLVYVLYGYANAMGYDLDEALRRVHKNNLDRCVQEDGTVKYREDGKVLRRTDAPKVNLDDLV